MTNSPHTHVGSTNSVANPHAPRINIIGMGPAGAILTLRAAERGMTVHCYDPASPDAQTLPHWPATYGVFSPEIPHWAQEFFDEPTDLTVITHPGSTRTLGFQYQMMCADSLATKVESLIHAQRVHLHQTTLQPASAGTGVSVDCRGAVVGNATLWQLAVGYVLSSSDANRLGLTTPTFMDWRTADPLRASQPPSFVYTQRVNDGWLVEETILATSTPPMAKIDPIFEELRHRLNNRIARLSGNTDWTTTCEILGEEVVAIPMGTQGEKVYDVNFGARAGFIHPATGYSIGTALQEADRVLDQIQRKQSRTTISWGTLWLVSTMNIEIAHILRRLGSLLIATADQRTLQSFFSCFFSLPIADQLAYLSGRSGIATARTMWRLRKKTGVRHEFLRPLFRHPVRYIRQAVDRKEI